MTNIAAIATTNPIAETATSPDLPLIALITERQSQLNISDEQLASALGFERPNVVRLIKQGRVKMPTAKVTLLAAVLALDPATLLRLVLSEEMPEVLALVDALLMPAVLNANERKLIESYRTLSHGRDVVPLVMEGNSIIALVVA